MLMQNFGGQTKSIMVFSEVTNWATNPKAQYLYSLGLLLNLYHA